VTFLNMKPKGRFCVCFFVAAIIFKINDNKNAINIVVILRT